MFCIYCGKEVVDYARYCNHCSKYIGETTNSKEDYNPELQTEIDVYGPVELLDDYPCTAREFEPDDNDTNMVFSYGSFPWQDEKDNDDREIDFGQEVRVYGTVNKTRFDFGPWGKNKKK